MTTKRAHLSNAKDLDAILLSVKTHPDKWDTVWDMAWIAARDAAHDALWDVPLVGAWGAILALIAYDDCAHLLTSNPEEVKLLAKFGVPTAVLLYPACLVFNETNELTMLV